MLKTLLRNFKKTPKPAVPPDSKSVPIDIGWHTPKTASELLNTPLRQQYLATIWQNVSMAPEMFQKLYREPIEKYAEMVQLLPASESHHHSHIGGMLDHGLEVISIAARLRQSYILPQNAIPEEQAKQRDVWTAVIIYAALLHDIGKCAVDIEIMLKDGRRWFPWQGIPSQPYNFRYIKGRDYNLHPTLGGFFANLLIPTSAFDWIAPFPKAFSDLSYFIAGHTDKAGMLSEIIQKADQISVTMALGGDPNKLSEKPQMSFAKQLLIALRQVIDSYKLNSQQGGCDGWLTDDGLWVMSKSTADNIRATLIKQGIAVPSQNGKLFDELQTHKLIDITSGGKAIWTCKVTSQEGWTHDKPFSLLKIPAHIIWENIDQRPNIFAGRVETNSEPMVSEIIANSSGIQELTINNEVVETGISECQKIDAEPVLPDVLTETITAEVDVQEIAERKDTIHADTSFNFVLDLFPEPNNEQIIESDTSKNSSESYAEPAVNSINSETIQEHQKQPKIKKNNSIVAMGDESNTALDDIDPQKFIAWIKSSVISGQMFINRPNAVLHIVENHLFLVTPSIFKIYLRDVVKRTDSESWELLQKRFQMLGIHRRQHMEDDSRNIWKCSVTGPNKKSELSGFLIPEPQLLIGDKMFLNNQWLTLQGELK